MLDLQSVNKMTDNTLTDYQKSVLRKLNYLIDKDRARTDMSDAFFAQNKELQKMSERLIELQGIEYAFKRLKRTALYWHSLLSEDQPRYRTHEDHSIAQTLIEELK